jgi:cobalt-zinc-cadmium efflux system protein
MHHHTADCHHHHDAPALESKTKQTQLAIALLLVGGFAVIELIVGVTSHSLALIAESGHMASDSFALILALLAAWLVQQPQKGLAGNQRLEPGAALINGLGLGAIALWIGWEAISHLQSPPNEIASLPMLLTAGVGVLVNGANVAVLHRGSAHDLNLKAAFLHVLADTVSSVGVILAAIAIATFHWLWADGAISLCVAALILASAIPLVVESLKTLLQSEN